MKGDKFVDIILTLILTLYLSFSDLIIKNMAGI